MEVIYLSYPLKNDMELPPTSMAIGFFDGVHLGHQMVIDKAKDYAYRHKIQSSVMTFDPHPKQVVGKRSNSVLITSLEEKIKLFDKLGIDIVYVVSFSEVFSKLSSKDFIEEFLILLNVSHITVGFDFTFGSRGAGKAKDLMEMARNRFKVTIIPPINDQNGIKISSTLIREHLKEGNLSAVNYYLGWNNISSGITYSSITYS